MRPWDLDTGAARLRKATQHLQGAWQQTSEQWNDEVSQSFGERYLEPISPAIKLSLDAVGRMQQLMNQIQHECEEGESYEL